MADPIPSLSTLANPELAYWRVLQAPSALSGDDYMVVPIVSRESGEQRGFITWMSYADAEYVRLGRQTRQFAVAVNLAASYANTEALDDNSGNLKIQLIGGQPEDDFALIDGDQTADEIANDTLLLFIVDPADSTSFEILTVKGIESPTGGHYPLHVKRARFGTTRLSFDMGDPAWIVRRADLDFFDHASLVAAACAGDPADQVVDFKLQPVVGFFKLPLELSEIAEQEVIMQP